MELMKKNNDDTPLWRLDNVSMPGTHGDRLKELSLDIPKGITALIGPSGAGKSSLLNLLVDFEQAGTGTIHRSASSLSFYWVPQNNGLWPHMNVVEHLAAMSKRPDGGRIDEILEKFELSHKKTAYPSQLSKGEQARLAMARALVVPHDVLILDEPLSHLSPARELVLWDLVLTIAGEFSTSIVYSTHSPKHVLGSAEHVVCLKEGGVIYSGSVETLYHSPPSFELAEYLGEINWLTEKSNMSIQAPIGRTFPLGVRPECIKLTKCDDASFKVLSSLFRGEITETVLEDLKSGECIKLKHRSSVIPEIGDLLDVLII